MNENESSRSKEIFNLCIGFSMLQCVFVGLLSRRSEKPLAEI